MDKLKSTLVFGLVALTATGLFATKAFATAGQWSSTGSTIYYNDGNVGLGTSTPNDPLVVNNPSTGFGKILVGDGRGSWWIEGNAYSDGNGYNNITSNGYFNNGWFRRESASEFWTMGTYVTKNNTGSFRISHANSQNGTNAIASGDLQHFFEVSANGKTYVRELVVTAAANWPDYVFSSDYKLMPLSEVEAYIKANNHLPNVPSQEEIEKDGIAVGDMQKVQMQKIEELTLHSIEQEKKINYLEARLAKLESLILNK